MAAVFEKCYFVILRGTKEGQECASIGHPEIFSISSGESQRKSGRALKKPERYKRYSRGRRGAHERNNRGTKDVQQRYKRWTTEVQQRPYTELRIHNTDSSILITKCWKKYYRMRNEISQKMAVSETTVNSSTWVQRILGLSNVLFYLEQRWTKEITLLCFGVCLKAHLEVSPRFMTHVLVWWVSSQEAYCQRWNRIEVHHNQN